MLSPTQIAYYLEKAKGAFIIEKAGKHHPNYVIIQSLQKWDKLTFLLLTDGLKGTPHLCSSPTKNI